MLVGAQSARATRPRSRLPAWTRGIIRPAALVEVGALVDVVAVFMCVVVVVEVDMVDVEEVMVEVAVDTVSSI